MFKKLRFEYYEYLSMDNRCTIEIKADDQGIVTFTADADILYHSEERFDRDESQRTIQGIEDIYLESWQDNYHPEGFDVCDGYTWIVEYEEEDPYKKIVKQGSNAYPWCFYKLLDLLIDGYDELEKILGKHVNQIECFYDRMEGRPYDLDEEKIVEYLENHIGERISSYQLIYKTASYLSGDLEKADLMDLHYQLFLIAEENGFFLDMSEHDNKLEGLPYNLRFVIKASHKIPPEKDLLEQ